MNIQLSLFTALAFAALPFSALAQFVDTFSMIDPAWVPNRFAPAGFTSVFFNGDDRLQLTIDQTGSTGNRPFGFDSAFYNTQGMQRSADIAGLWSLSAQVYVSSAFNTTTGSLVASELWGHSGTTPAGGAYLILGFTNASPTDALNLAAADRSFRFQAFDSNTGNWFDLGVPSGFIFDTWHTLTGTSTGSAFEYRIDGALVLSNPTSAGNDLLSGMIQGINFGDSASYSVYWDNAIASASAIPEPATNAFIAALGALGLAVWRRRRAASAARV